MAADPKVVIRNLEELRALTGDAEGAQRVAWTDTWLEARRWFEGKLKEMPFPVEHHCDAAGNGWATLVGKSPKTLILGSHLDSVPNGGWLDGCLGVLAALEVMASIARRTDGQPPVTVRLVDFADEEGARFGRSLFGSSAAAGRSSVDADRGRTDKDGVRYEDALARCGVVIDRVGDASIELREAAAYLELHIEQGPVLEGLRKPLGVVLGTKGVERWAVSFNGQEAHSGSTPMKVRKDALAAAARFALETRAIALQNEDAVATVGSVKTLPGIVTAVVGRCEVTLDMRDLNATVLEGMLAQARAASERFAAEEGCTVAWSRIWGIEPLPFDAALIGLCESAIEETAGVSHRLPSGPLHDAAEIARAGVPTAMMFVQSLNGLSHNRAEDTSREDLELAVEAFERLAEKTMAWLAS